MPPNKPRSRDLAAIHIAAQQLGMDDATYRDMLWTIARVRSAKDLDWAGRRAVLDHLRACGAKAERPSRPSHEWSWVDAAAANKRPLLRKIIVLCRELGLERGRQMRYCEGVARRQHGNERHLQMMDASELWRIVCALERTLRYRTPGEPPPEGGISSESDPA